VCYGIGFRKETLPCLLLALAERWLDLADAEEKRAKADQGSRVIDRRDGRPVLASPVDGEFVKILAETDRPERFL